MNIPADLKYTPSHEWVRVEADGTLTVGITHHAQDLLGDMVFIETPAAGRTLAKGEECAVVESVKAASDVYAPVAGEVIAATAMSSPAPTRSTRTPTLRGCSRSSRPTRAMSPNCSTPRRTRSWSSRKHTRGRQGLGLGDVRLRRAPYILHRLPLAPKS